MKKTIFAFAVFTLAACYSTNAQIQKGNYLIGGDLANFDISLNEGGNFSMGLSPKVAWFIKNNTAVGGYVNLSLATAKGQGTTVGYGVGALGRYYFNDEKINVLRHSRFFVEGNVGIEGLNYSTGGSTNGLGIGVGPGLAYFVTPNIGLEGLLKYNNITGGGSTTSSSNLHLNIGFQIYLTRKAVKNAAANTQ